MTSHDDDTASRNRAALTVGMRWGPTVLMAAWRAWRKRRKRRKAKKAKGKER